MSDYPLCGCEIIDLNTGNCLQEIQLGYEEGNHNNSVCFGVERYEPTDKYPLIYTSVTYGERDVYVYRLQEISGTFSMTKVQTIHLLPRPVYNDTFPTSFVDSRGFLWTEGEKVSNTQNAIYIKYRLPLLSEGTEVTMTEEDVIDNCELFVGNPYGIFTSGAEQDGEIIDGILYQAFGFADRAWINAIDLDAKKIVSTIPLHHSNLNAEPEAVFQYDGMLGVSFNGIGGLIVGLTFD